MSVNLPQLTQSQIVAKPITSEIQKLRMSKELDIQSDTFEKEEELEVKRGCLINPFEKFAEAKKLKNKIKESLPKTQHAYIPYLNKISLDGLKKLGFANEKEEINQNLLKLFILHQYSDNFDPYLEKMDISKKDKKILNKMFAENRYKNDKLDIDFPNVNLLSSVILEPFPFNLRIGNTDNIFLPSVFIPADILGEDSPEGIRTRVFNPVYRINEHPINPTSPDNVFKNLLALYTYSINPNLYINMADNRTAKTEEEKQNTLNTLINKHRYYTDNIGGICRNLNIDENEIAGRVDLLIKAVCKHFISEFITKRAEHSPIIQKLRQDEDVAPFINDAINQEKAEMNAYVDEIFINYDEGQGHGNQSLSDRYNEYNLISQQLFNVEQQSYVPKFYVDSNFATLYKDPSGLGYDFSTNKIVTSLIGCPFDRKTIEKDLADLESKGFGELKTKYKRLNEEEKNEFHNLLEFSNLRHELRHFQQNIFIIRLIGPENYVKTFKPKMSLEYINQLYNAFGGELTNEDDKQQAEKYLKAQQRYASDKLSSYKKYRGNLIEQDARTAQYNWIFQQLEQNRN